VTTDALIRLVAAVAAVAIAGAPAASFVVGKVRLWKPAEAQPASFGIREMRTVLDLAETLRAAGCVEGVALCQQLLDVMLGGCPSKGKK
jgi:hypothetical protein